MSATKYLYSSSSKWITFKSDKYAFNTKSGQIGWVPDGLEHVVDKNGTYLGTIVEDRLYTVFPVPVFANPNYPGAPNYPGPVNYPGHAGYSPLTGTYKDVDASLLS